MSHDPIFNQHRFFLVDQLRAEFVLCRSTERAIKKDPRVLDHLRSDKVQKFAAVRSGADIDNALATEGGMDDLPLSELIEPLLKQHADLRQMARDLLSCLNRVAVLTLDQSSAEKLVALLEARYIAHVWLDWRHYIRSRRQVGDGRARIFAPLEHLVHRVAKNMAKSVIPESHDEVGKRSLNDEDFWKKLAKDAKKIEASYPGWFAKIHRKDED